MIRILGGGATLLILMLVAFMGLDLFIRGGGAISLTYLVGEPSDLGRSGGIAPMLVNTLLIVGAATLTACAVSLPCAVAYCECVGPNWFRGILHAVLDIGVGTPRIVWGLFGGVFFGGVCGLGFSVTCGVLTLACLLAPILTTGFINGIAAVDPRLREQCFALGISPWVACWHQVLPKARPGLVAAVALAAGRGCGDAAALLFTAGLATHWVGSASDSAATLAVFIFNLLSSVPGGQKAAYSAAAVLFLLTFFIQWVIAGTQHEERLAT